MAKSGKKVVEKKQVKPAPKAKAPAKPVAKPAAKAPAKPAPKVVAKVVAKPVPKAAPVS